MVGPVSMEDFSGGSIDFNSKNDVKERHPKDELYPFVDDTAPGLLDGAAT